VRRVVLNKENLPADAGRVRSSRAEFAARLKLYAALLLFQSGELSAGATCELGGVDRFVFLAECNRHRIDVIDYPPEELRADLDAIRRSSD
jgi:predicted HTH domain antitoxin